MTTESLLNRLRTVPVAYAAARLGYRWILASVWALLRVVSPTWTRQGPPRGTFSALELLQQGKVPGRLIRGPSPAPKGNFPVCVAAKLGQEHLGSWPSFWTLHAHARLVGKTLSLMNEDKRVCAEAVYAPYIHLSDPAMRYLRLPPAVRVHGNYTSIASRWTANFHHWYMDAMPRLAALAEFPSDTQILGPWPLLRFQEETMSWLGLSERYRPTANEHLEVENYYFAAPTSMTGGFDANTIAFLRSKFLHMAADHYDSPRRFFLHRVNKGRGIWNEKEVLRFFEDLGWDIIDTELLSMAEQVQLFSKAEAVCGVHGGGLTNILWCNSGCRAYELLASNFLNGVFERLATLVGIEHRFAIFPGTADFKARVDLNQLARLIGSEC